MQIVTTTNARKNIKALVDRVRDSGAVFGIGRRDTVDALLIPFPSDYRKTSNDITNINAYSRSFDFLSEEPDLYTVADLRERYA